MGDWEVAGYLRRQDRADEALYKTISDVIKAFEKMERKPKVLREPIAKLKKQTKKHKKGEDE
jgi:hypothetical protein